MTDDPSIHAMALAKSRLEEQDARIAALEEARKRLLSEMRRYGPVLARLEGYPDLWSEFTAGLGIATTNGYFAALKDSQ